MLVILQCVVQSGIIGQAQVSSEPEYSSVLTEWRMAILYIEGIQLLFWSITFLHFEMKTV